MTSHDFLRLGDYNSGRLADHDRVQVVADDRSANGRVLARVIMHHDCRHTRAGDNALKQGFAAAES